jgi:hypothetical protein
MANQNGLRMSGRLHGGIQRWHSPGTASEKEDLNLILESDLTL